MILCRTSNYALQPTRFARGGAWSLERAKENSMFRSITFVLLCAAAMSASAGQPESAAQAPTNAEIRQQYAANLAKAAKDQQESHARNAKIMARAEALLTRQEEMVKRQEKDFARFEKILDTWEREQVQYQKYLDSLGRK